MGRGRIHSAAAFFGGEVAPAALMAETSSAE